MDFTVWGLICAVGVLTSPDSGQASVLPSPENVTVSCDNFETFVYWNYSEHLVAPFFQINLTSNDGKSWSSFKSVDRYANITSGLNNIPVNYDSFTIIIRAMNKTHASNFSPPVEFAYDNRVGEDIMLCKLDFPPINLEYHYGFLTLKFQNPMHLYENTPALKYLKDNKDPKLETSKLSYNVIDESNITTVFSCPYQTAICEEKLHISDKEDKYCVDLSGQIVSAEVRAARICYSGLKLKGLPPSITMTIVLTSLLVVMAAVLGAVMFRKRIVKTHPTTPKNLTSFRNQKGAVLPGPSENFSPSPLSVVPSPSETSEDPLLPDHTWNSGRSSADCSHFHLLTQEQQGGASPENKEEERNTESTEWPSDGSSTDPDYPSNPELLERSGGTLLSDYDSPHSMEMSSGDKEEERNTESTEWPSDGSSTDPDYPPNPELLERSGGTLVSDYDSRHVISMEMSSGDWVEGYSARDPVA